MGLSRRKSYSIIMMYNRTRRALLIFIYGISKKRTDHILLRSKIKKLVPITLANLGVFSILYDVPVSMGDVVRALRSQPHRPLDVSTSAPRRNRPRYHILLIFVVLLELLYART